MSFEIQSQEESSRSSANHLPQLDLRTCPVRTHPTHTRFEQDPDNRHGGPIQNHQISRRPGPDASVVGWFGLSTCSSGKTLVRSGNIYAKKFKFSLILALFLSPDPPESTSVRPYALQLTMELNPRSMWEAFSKCRRTVRSSLIFMSRTQTPRPGLVQIAHTAA